MSEKIKAAKADYEKAFSTATEFHKSLKPGEVTAEETARFETLMDEADKAKGLYEAAIQADEKEKNLNARLSGHNDFAHKSAGFLPNVGASRDDDDGEDFRVQTIKSYSNLSPIKGTTLFMQGGKVGAMVKSLDGRNYEFVPLSDAESWNENPASKAIATAEYSDAFYRSLRGKIDNQSRKSLQAGSDAAGGYTAPPEFVAQVIQRLPGLTVVEERATVVTTSRDRMEAPRVKGASTDGTMYSSAVKFTMVGDKSTPDADTEPAFENVELAVHTAKMSTRLNRNLIADSEFDIAAFLVGEYRRASQLGKDDKRLTGTGAREPVGIVNDDGISTVNTGHATDVLKTSIINLIHSLPAQYRTGAILAVSADYLKKVALLEDGNDRFLWNPGMGGLVEGMAPTIAGTNYVVTDFLDSVGAGTRPAFYGNLAFYWAVNRMQLAVQVLREKYAEDNEDGYVAFIRFTGAVTVPEAFRIQVVGA